MPLRRTHAGQGLDVRHDSRPLGLKPPPRGPHAAQPGIRKTVEKFAERENRLYHQGANELRIGGTFAAGVNGQAVASNGLTTS